MMKKISAGNVKKKKKGQLKDIEDNSRHETVWRKAVSGVL